jgi:putative hemolysin
MTAFIVFAGCVLLVAWLSAGTMAVRSASRIWLRHWAEQGLRGAAAVLTYLERPQRLLVAGNVGVAFAVGIAGLWIGWRFHGAQHVAIVAFIAYAVIVIVIGQLVPRAIARRWPAGVIPIAMPMLRAAEVLTVPILALVRRVRGSAPTTDAHGEPRDAMHELLREGELEGVGRRDEISIISGVMDFGEKSVRDVMTPRDDVFAVPESLDAQSVGRLIAQSAFSRVPVFRGSLDEIVGMYHAFDVLKVRAETLPPLRAVAYTPADYRCNELLFRMLRARIHLAVVHDERGRTLGIATLEDLLEELVGDIRDEHDDPVSAVGATARPAPQVPAA